MTNHSLDDQLDQIEQQFNELSTTLVDGDANGVRLASAALQQLAVDLIQMVDEMGSASLASHSRGQRIQLLASAIPSLRENLLRRSAYVDRALEMIIPATQKTTYAGGGAYGGGVRQSGAFKVLSA